MTIYIEDTIAAISTPIGYAGIGIIRMSGKDSINILNKFFVRKDHDIIDRKMSYGYMVDEKNNRVDEVLVCVMLAPKTYTKEDVVEINCHGGIVAVKKILNIILMNGARLAEPGEFTKRAFLNGRMDLTQAEAVMDIINAKTEQGMQISIKQLEGSISKKIKIIRDDILNMLAHIEAIIDYPEYDIEDISYSEMAKSSKEVLKKVNELIYNAENGKIMREGISTSIIGKPNVGKSSLLNAMIGDNRAIVTDIPGTTRDTIEEFISIDGIPLKIIDTAGIRDTENEIEKIGIQKTKNSIDLSDLILLILDVNQTIDEDDYILLDMVKNKNTIIVLNKIDKEKKISEQIVKSFNLPFVEISATEEKGLRELKELILKSISEDGIEKEAWDFISNVRHVQLLNSARICLENAINTIESKMPLEIVTIDLKEGWSLLGEITGETVKDDLIDKIFSNFCIGK